MTIPIAVYILLAIVITGFVFMFIYANKKDFDQSIKRSLAEEALEDYLVRIKNAYDLSVLDEIYNSIFKDTRIFIEKNEDELHFIVNGLRDKMRYITTVYHIKSETIYYIKNNGL